MNQRPVRRTRKGDFEIRLSDQERLLISDLVAQLTAVIDQEAAPENPLLRRLFPTAHPDNPDLESSYKEMVEGDLLDLRKEKLLLVTATLDQKSIDEAALFAWMGVINDLRLVIGTYLDVSEDDNQDTYGPGNPEADTYAIYQYLSYLLDSILDALT